MKSRLIKLFSILAAFFAFILITYTILTYLYPKKYSEYVTKYAAEYDLDENLVYSIIKCESGFNENSVSHAGAIGLMQITEPTFEWAAQKNGDIECTVNSLYSPNINIKYGCYIYSLFYNEFADTKTALTCYNAGRGKVLEWLKNSEYSEDGILLKSIPYPETEKYVQKVETAMRMYELLY